MPKKAKKMHPSTLTMHYENTKTTAWINLTEVSPNLTPTAIYNQKINMKFVSHNKKSTK